MTKEEKYDWQPSMDYLVLTVKNVGFAHVFKNGDFFDWQISLICHPNYRRYVPAYRGTSSSLEAAKDDAEKYFEESR